MEQTGWEPGLRGGGKRAGRSGSLQSDGKGVGRAARWWEGGERAAEWWQGGRKGAGRMQRAAEWWQGGQEWNGQVGRGCGVVERGCGKGVEAYRVMGRGWEGL